MKKCNKGFTLLELLIAVAVLAIIIAPMLRGFVSSHRVNAKSRHLMRATTLAQNEMEIFEKEKLEDLIIMEETDSAGNTAPRYAVDTSDFETDSDGDDHTIYKFTRSGVINDGSDMNMFDVVVTIRPSISSTGYGYEQQNTKGMLFMNTVSGVDSATYIQRVRNEVNANGDDEEVYKLYEIRQYPESITGHRWTPEMFGEELERTITLKIEQEDQAGVMTTVAKIRYDYTLTGYNILPPEYENYTTKDKIFFNNAQTLDDAGNPIALKSVYLYYAPRYDTIYPDKIIIENKDKLPVNIYIIRQNILDAADQIIGVYEDPILGPQNTVNSRYPTYQAQVEIHEGFDAEGKTYGRYFTNLNLDQPGVTGTGAPVNLKLFDCDTGQEFNARNEVIGYTDMRSLDATEKKDRIYTMETAVYEHGADPLTSDPVVRLTGTKIE